MQISSKYSNGKTYPNKCFANADNVTLVNQQVCGADGKFYTNKCSAIAASITSSEENALDNRIFKSLDNRIFKSLDNRIFKLLNLLFFYIRVSTNLTQDVSQR